MAALSKYTPLVSSKQSQVKTGQNSIEMPRKSNLNRNRQNKDFEGSENDNNHVGTTSVHSVNMGANSINGRAESSRHSRSNIQQDTTYGILRGPSMFARVKES